jgi:predicted secreted Zn-dependent protease
MTKIVRTRSAVVGIGGLLTFLHVLPPAAQTVTDGVESSASVSYYDVGGETWQEVLADLAIKRQAVAGIDQRYEAFTSWDVSVIFPTPDHKCSEPFARHGVAAGIVVKVDEKLKFPHLSTFARLSQIDRQCWSAYDRDIRDHEEGHLKITASYARDLLLAIRASHFTSCSEYDQLASMYGMHLHNAQDDYDALTEHGALQSRAHHDVQLPRAYGKMLWCMP